MVKAYPAKEAIGGPASRLGAMLPSIRRFASGHRRDLRPRVRGVQRRRRRGLTGAGGTAHRPGEQAEYGQARARANSLRRQ